MVKRAVAFYPALGKKPQVLRKEAPGFVANRLQAAPFREAVNLVVLSVVTESELDTIVTSSVGPRWAGRRPCHSFVRPEIQAKPPPSPPAIDPLSR